MRLAPSLLAASLLVIGCGSKTDSSPTATAAPSTAPTTSAARSAPPSGSGTLKLAPVDTPGPLKLSAPIGWAVKTSPPRDKSLSTIASLRPDCGDGPDIVAMIQLDQNKSSGAALLADQYKGEKQVWMNGFDCVVDELHNEVMCAAKPAGFPGVISVFFATTDEGVFKQIAPAELTSSIAASLSWEGEVSDLKEWQRPATAEAKTVCPNPKK